MLPGQLLHCTHYHVGLRNSNYYGESDGTVTLSALQVDLDVVVREDLMAFLKEESEQRGCTIVYITHIFDGMEAWPTHIGFLAKGEFERVERAENIPELKEGKLMELVEAFLLKHWVSRIKSGAEHPENQKKFEYMRNNGYVAGRMASSVKA